MLPSVLPAPTMVCSSSMNKRMRPSDFSTSASTAFRRSSNSPRYLAPAMSAPMSRANRALFFRPSGTSCLRMRWARPSTMAVLPTPASPMSTGLFLVRRDRMRMQRRISSSRPMTGSRRPARASSTRSRPYFLRASYVPSGLSLVTRWEPRTSFSTPRTFSRSKPKRELTRPAPVERGSCSSTRNRCSTLTYSSFMERARSRAATTALFTRSVTYICPGCEPGPETLGSLSSSASRALAYSPGSAPAFSSRPGTSPRSWRARASSRCSASTAWWPDLTARFWASDKASWLFCVSLEMSISSSSSSGSAPGA